MLSILIPIYNFEIYALVKELSMQCLNTKIDFEILCFDDGSDKPFKKSNQVIQQFPKVIYKELPQNLGRSKIRNTLAQAAKFQYLLFMDCDSKVVLNNYIANYLAVLNPNTLVYGGRVYAKDKPNDRRFILHYSYGKHREEILTEERESLSYQKFMTNNFLIPKSVFFKIKFEESISGYGHEDTLFGLALQKQEVPIKHIKNPLEHLGLEDKAVFLEKQQVAIQNLFQLYINGYNIQTSLLNTYLLIKKWKMNRLILWGLTIFKSFIKRNLNSRHPKLFFLDLYKLQYLLSIDRQSDKKLI